MKSKPTKKSATKAITVAVSEAEAKTAALTRAQSKRLTELVAIIREAKRSITASALIMGRALKEVRDEALWRADTRDGFEAWLAERDLVSAGYARKLIDVVEALPNAKALPYGVEKLWELARYASDAERKGGVKSLLEAKATINDRPVSDLSEQEIHDARMALTENVKKEKERDPMKAKKRALATRAESALSKRTGASVKITAKRVGDEWRFVIDASEEALRGLMGE